MNLKSVTITTNFSEVDPIGKITIRLFLSKKCMKLPETPNEMLTKFKLSNEIKNVLKPCWR